MVFLYPRPVILGESEENAMMDPGDHTQLIHSIELLGEFEDRSRTTWFLGGSRRYLDEFLA